MVDHAVLTEVISDPAIKRDKLPAKDPREGSEKRSAKKEGKIELLLTRPTWPHACTEVAPSLDRGVPLAIYTGARLSEIAGLKIAEVDMEQKFISVAPKTNRGLKAAQGKRNVPWHPELERLQSGARVAQRGNFELFQCSSELLTRSFMFVTPGFGVTGQMRLRAHQMKGRAE